MRFLFSFEVFAILFVVIFSVEVKADLGRETGLRVPRFVSMNSAKVNLRAGPGMRYPIQWIFQRKSLPVQIIAESDKWRKIRDFEDIEGWVHQSMLSGRRYAIVVGAIRQLKRASSSASKTIALLEPGVIVRLEKCAGIWCFVEAEPYDGWINRTNIWGVDKNE